MDWFTLALISMFAYGLQNFTYKVIAEKNIRTWQSLHWSFIFCAAIALLAGNLEHTQKETILPMVIFAIIQGTFYLLSRYIKVESFRHIPTVVALPISRSHFALTALLAITILGEPATKNTALGLALFMSAILILSTENSHNKTSKGTYKKGILLALATALFTTISEFMVKLASTNYPSGPFILSTYIWLSTVTTSARLAPKNSPRTPACTKKELKSGLILSIFNYLSFSTAIASLKTGPASVIFPIIGLNMLVTLTLSILIYHERLTIRRITAILASIAAIAILR